MHFSFEALPTELQMRIISFTDLVTDTPARDLTNIPRRLPQWHLPAQDRYHPRSWLQDVAYPDPSMCCGRCEGFIKPDECECRPMQRICSWTPGHRTPNTLCECLIFAHPILAVNRNMRTLGLDHVYRNALFEIGPNSSDNLWPIKGIILDVDAMKLACLKNLRVIINLKNDDSLDGMDETPYNSLCTWWKPLLSDLWDRCKRHDASIEVILIGHPTRAAEDLVGLLEGMVESLGYHNITLRVADDEWLSDRENGWMVWSSKERGQRYVIISAASRSVLLA